jgi:hypothetical protein
VLLLDYFETILKSLLVDTWHYDEVFLHNGIERHYYQNYYFDPSNGIPNLFRAKVTMIGFDLDKKRINVYSIYHPDSNKDFTTHYYGVTAWDEFVVKLDYENPNTEINEFSYLIREIVREELFSKTPLKFEFENTLKRKEEFVNSLNHLRLAKMDELDTLFPLLSLESNASYSSGIQNSKIALSYFGEFEKVFRDIMFIPKDRRSQNGSFSTIAKSFSNEFFDKILSNFYFSNFSKDYKIDVANLVAEQVEESHPDSKLKLTIASTYDFLKMMILNKKINEFHPFFVKMIFNELSYFLIKEEKFDTSMFLSNIKVYGICDRKKPVIDIVKEFLSFMLNYFSASTPMYCSIELNSSLESFNLWNLISRDFKNDNRICFEIESYNTNKQIPADFFLKDEVIRESLIQKSVSLHPELRKTINDLKNRVDMILNL